MSLKLSVGKVRNRKWYLAYLTADEYDWPTRHLTPRELELARSLKTIDCFKNEALIDLERRYVASKNSLKKKG